MNYEAFRREWVRHFAGDVSPVSIEKYILCHGMAWNFIWHAFSWELMPEGAFLEGDAARRAFDEVEKDGAMGIDPFEENAACVSLPVDLRTAKAIEALTEYYVVGKDFVWTYIKTHEEDLCGPYFCVRRTDSSENYDEAVAMNAIHEQRLAKEEREREKRKKRRLAAAVSVGLAAAAGAMAWLLIRSYRE